jgi:hypothetical protein
VVHQARLVLILLIWLPTQLQWMLPQEQCCLLFLDFLFPVLGFSLLASSLRRLKSIISAQRIFTASSLSLNRHHSRSLNSPPAYLSRPSLGTSHTTGTITASLLGIFTASTLSLNSHHSVNSHKYFFVKILYRYTSSRSPILHDRLPSFEISSFFMGQFGISHYGNKRPTYSKVQRSEVT